jgi:hypothetical protein
MLQGSAGIECHPCAILIPRGPAAEPRNYNGQTGAVQGYEAAREKRRGRALIPRLRARLTSCPCNFQLSDTTMRTRRFYGAAARTIFERCEHRLIDLPHVEIVLAGILAAAIVLALVIWFSR